MIRKAPLSEVVQRFYEELPFNQHRDVPTAAASVRAHGLGASYPDLADWLRRARPGATVFEVGCGGGWLAATMAWHDHVRVRAIDLTPKAVARARALVEELELEEVVIDLGDVMEADLGGPYDLVVSLGVLHHTADARQAFHRLADCVAPGGRLYVGLYHGPGRRPFLEHFQRLLEAEGEAAAMEAYGQMDAVRAMDPVHLESWFRDQVLHPHETQHTLQEVAGWCQSAGLRLVSTSINRFASIEDLEALWALEATYAERSLEAIASRRYFPGFFTAMAQRSEL